MNLSVCMIVKNEEEVISRCLTCVKKFADEIVVIDTGSTDQTKNIVKNFTEKLYDFKWQDDFSIARNFAFSKATCDLIMWLDADDIVLDEDIDKINQLKKRETQADMYMLEYVMTHKADMTPIFKYMRERIFLREKNYKWVDPIHEVIIPSGKVECLPIKIYHEKIKATPSQRNLKIYRKLLLKKIKFSPRQQFYYARELMFNQKYKQAITEFNKFLKMPNSWIENKLQAHIDLSRCYVALGEREKALNVLFKSFMFSEPRSEITCRIGNIFYNLKKYDQAIFWYKEALNSNYHYDNGAFIESDMHDFIPSIQLCCAYYLKNDYENAYKYHLISRNIKPEDPVVIYNQNFFAKHFENLLK